MLVLLLAELCEGRKEKATKMWRLCAIPQPGRSPVENIIPEPGRSPVESKIPEPGRSPVIQSPAGPAQCESMSDSRARSAPGPRPVEGRIPAPGLRPVRARSAPGPRIGGVIT